MHICVTGPNGMLGKAVLRALHEMGHQPLPLPDDILTMQTVLAPLVINCAGVVKQRQVPDSEVMRVNAVGPHVLAEACDKWSDGRLVQVSTDCVFDGSPGPHDEDSPTTGRDVYGRSKIAGEVTRPPHLTVRTSFIGFGERGLIADLFRAEGGEIPAGTSETVVEGSRHWLWSGQTVDCVAKLLVLLATSRNIVGRVHIPGRAISRVELLWKLVQHFGLNVTVVDNGKPGQDRRLTSKRWGQLGLPWPPSLDEQLRTMTDDRGHHAGTLSPIPAISRISSSVSQWTGLYE